MKKVSSVDEYISSAPKEVQPKLIQLREVILSTIPEAEEKISYAMPYYGKNGRVAYFGYAKKHIGLYVMQPAVAENREALKKYSTSKDVTIRFPLEEALPIALIKKLIKTRLEWMKNNPKK